MIIPQQMSATALRQNVYQTLDSVIKENRPVIIERPEGTVMIINAKKEQESFFDNMPKRNVRAPGVTDDELIYHNLGQWSGAPELDEDY